MTSGEIAHQFRVKEIFSLVAEAAPAHREALLARCCADDPALAREVADLLALRGRQDLTLDLPAPLPPGLPEPRVDGLLSRYQAGDVLGERYRIVRLLAAGGMGEVYAAFDIEANLPVAIKCIRRWADLGGAAEARLRREVEMAGEIHHPNVCRVYGLGEHEGVCFCVMELLAGETLAARLAKGNRLTPAEALAIAKQVLLGVEAAHTAGVLHRDLKPANIMLTADRVVIIDFGLAAAVPDRKEALRTLTATGALVGTLAYVAPEQLDGARCTQASDIYSAGVILYEMLMGVKPFDAASPFQLAAQKVKQRRIAPVLRKRRLPLVWQQAIEGCLRAKPARRYQSAAAVYTLLERGRPDWAYRVSRWSRRFMPSAAVLLCAVLAWLAWRNASAGYRPSVEASALYAQAGAAMNASATERAVPLLEQAVLRDPQFILARSLLAAAYAKVDQPDKARSAVLQATAASDARRLLGRAEKQALLAARAAVLGDFVLAADGYGRVAALSRGAERGQALVARALMLEQAGRAQAAQATIEDVLREDANHGPARIRLGLLLCRRSDFARADGEFRRAELAYEREGNLEGLADVLLARSAGIGSRELEQFRSDIERVQQLSLRTGNRHQALSAMLHSVTLAEIEREYERAVALAREAARQAAEGGMPVLAARATGELGYALLFAKRFDEAMPPLLESVRMAERAGLSPATVASNRMRLGEALFDNGRLEEAVGTMEPAMRWLRNNGSRSRFPMALIKWGTALAGSKRFEECVPVFQEALDLAVQNGNELQQAVALQRLANFHSSRDLRESLRYWDRALALARKTRQTNAYFARAAGVRMLAGEFAAARRLFAEAEQVAATYERGVDRDMLMGDIGWGRAEFAYLQGDCARALRLTLQLRPRGARDRVSLVRYRYCALGMDRAQLLRSLAFGSAQADAYPSPGHPTGAHLSAFAAEMALHLADWRTARRYAQRGVEQARAGSNRAAELENLLLLRAAQRRLADTAEVDRLSVRVLQVAAQFGFDPPSRFGGRYDLLRLWLAAETAGPEVAADQCRSLTARAAMDAIR